MKETTKLIKKLEKITGKRVIFQEFREIPDEIVLSNDKIEDLARRAFFLTLSRTAVKELYKKHFTSLLQASNVIADENKVKVYIDKYKDKIMSYYDKITTEKDVLIKQ